ncbi:MAG: alpha-glucan family phosphorylase, partial [Myxococcales bacterium]|nr:alpha-glucan family phosphorylase [Myxococcales bacterium]
MSEYLNRQVAYFSMEIALEDRLPTYCGGLGVLAGDTIRSAADLRVPIICVSLVHRKGYFRQRIDEHGNQSEEAVEWPVEEWLEPTSARTVVRVEGRDVHVRAWCYRVRGATGHDVPVYFLDTNLPENTQDDRHITDHLYLGDRRYRLLQESVLGVGGLQLLELLGHSGIHTIHMNEGHASLAALAAFSGELTKGRTRDAAIEETKKRFVFTTHTPVDAGHDRFDNGMAKSILTPEDFKALETLHGQGARLDMTKVALDLSRYANAVAYRHGEVSREMFPGYAIDAITNGVHTTSWVTPPFAQLFDKYFPKWRSDSYELRHAFRIPDGEIWDAHQLSKGILLRKVEERTGQKLDPGVFTLGFARRVVGYKRAALLLKDVARLRDLAKRHG